VLLFIAPKKHLAKAETASADEHAGHAHETEATIESFLTNASKSLSLKEKTEFDDLVAAAGKSVVDTAWVPVVQFWDRLRRPDF
ncbi:hypothetical protein NK983_32680, partial [Salmonella enterica subsp. enterica serovar Typhimurium]|nr:hypothetical protein [Salmonella enterica subsp. enterica serovar Typhimurium]